ncbi:MAG: DUF3015 family protein [Spongiibacteraceae bacterium]
MGVAKSDQTLFRSVMQKNFTAIFNSESVTGSEVAEQVSKVMAENASLSKYVS